MRIKGTWISSYLKIFLSDMYNCECCRRACAPRYDSSILSIGVWTSDVVIPDCVDPAKCSSASFQLISAPVRDGSGRPLTAVNSNMSSRQIVVVQSSGQRSLIIRRAREPSLVKTAVALQAGTRKRGCQSTA